MKRIKQICALLLANVLMLGVVIQSGVVGVFAENVEQSAEPIVQIIEPAPEEPTPAEPTPAEPAPVEPIPDAPIENELPALSLYEQLMACGSLIELDALLFAEENAAALAGLSQEELSMLLARVEELCLAIPEPTESDLLLKERLVAKLNEYIIVTCPECLDVNGAHNEGCSAMEPVCICGSENGGHIEGCPLYVPEIAACEECGVAGGHAETCSQYVEPTASYPWAELTDAELAAWLMDEANAEAVRAILADETTEEYALLTSRIEAILGGENAVLAGQLLAYLTALSETDEADVLADKPDEYIYFDLAAGDVTIGAVDAEGKKTYSGKVYVNGVPTDVKGVHSDGNKYYIYQSTEANKLETGYTDDIAYGDKTGCRVPHYDRVAFNGQSWTEYITNNINVEDVINNWETAAAAFGRTALGEQKPGDDKTSTGNHITFIASQDYIADVTIDNIWTYYQAFGNERNVGGITAHFVDKRNMKIYLRLKGDNRFGNIHYGAKEGTQNKIFFIDGEEGQAEGSITVADFPKDLDKNHWGSAIGGDDAKCDSADGIVIESGVIYAGTTYDDNCTAIGGGGNNFGGVTIKNGIVTAVAATTGTAIGGGIGWNGGGGNAKVEISGGTIYAYNLGIHTGARDKYELFVHAIAIGGGSSQNSAGNARTIVNISDGTVYAQSTGGAAIGGGGSTKQTGGNAEINITGGTIIAKSTTGKYRGTANASEVDIPAGVSIGGGTGNTGGGSVTLNISGNNTVLRTGSIGGGITTGSGNIGSATVNIDGGDITGQVIMKGGTGDKCTFTMTDGRIHDSDVVNGYTIPAGLIPKVNDVKIEFIEKNGGAVWMEDTGGVTTITGGTIEGCTAELGGAIYMLGGNFYMSKQSLTKYGIIKNCTAEKGGAVYMNGGSFEITGGKLTGNRAVIDINAAPADNPAAVDDSLDTPAAPPIDGVNPDATTGWGGAVCVEGGNVTVEDGIVVKAQSTLLTEDQPADTGGGDTHTTIIEKNTAVYGGAIYVSGGDVKIHGGEIMNNLASSYGGGVYLTNGNVSLDRGHILRNAAIDGGGVYLPQGTFLIDCKYHSNDEPIHGGEIAGNVATRDGGGIYLTTDPELTAGSIHGNTAGENGGGVCVVRGGKLTLESDQMLIYNNKATNGGGVYVKGGNVLIATGRIWNNYAQYGGGVYLADGIFTMNSEEPISTPDEEAIRQNEAAISQNHASVNGGGIYLRTAPDLQAGQIALNTAEGNGGGMYIDGCMVNLAPSGTVNIARNGAKNGGGIYIHGLKYENEHPGNTGGSTDPAGEAVQLDAISTATPASDTGLRIHDGDGNLTFAENKATESGGAICIEMGGCELSSEKTSVVANIAKNGGGVAVLNGNFTMTKGSIGADKTLDTNEGPISNANTASNGGGVYVSDGDVWLLGGKIQYNRAVFPTDPTSGESGGNGGGIYVSEGDINVVYSEIEHNFADWDGGGFFVSAIQKNVNVVMLSGSLCYNEAKNSGGGMAVESDPTQPMVIDVKIGCLLDHKVNNTPQFPIDYTDNYKQYEDHAAQYIDQGEKCKHGSCPIVKNNKAVTYGGGFYMNSKKSKLAFYCIEESNNVASSKESTEGLDIEGGTIVIGDEEYHNNAHDISPEGKKLESPRGYIIMDNATLVIGGTVDVYGDMSNPIFRDPITVDIQDKQNDHFFDHRRVREGEEITHYKVHYFENFFGTGVYQEHNYTKDNSTIIIPGVLFTHPGYRILGWYTAAEYNPDTDTAQSFYPVGEKFDLSRVPQMGKQDIEGCDTCKKTTAVDETLLKLYAIWEANGYTVRFNPNPPNDAEPYIGSMEDQVFTYQEEGLTTNLITNDFHIDGYVFKHWARNPDGTGEAFADEQPVGNLTTENGVTINLYAIWEECDHTHPERWLYSVNNNTSTLIRDCSCGGQTLRATLTAQNAVYDGYDHPAILTYDALAWGEDKPIVTYTGNWLDDGLTHSGIGPVLSIDGKPFHAGEYTASITKYNTDENGNKISVIASTKYTILKADQPAPVKPTFTLSGSSMIIDKLNSPTLIGDEAKAQYRLAYYEGTELKNTDWESIADGYNALHITLEAAYTNYYVEAQYKELDDYNASEITRTDPEYHFGNVIIKVVCDTGISNEPPVANDPDHATDVTSNGMTLKVNLDDKYYLVSGEGNYDINITAEHTDDKTQLPPPSAAKVADSVGKYNITSIRDKSIVTITIGKARKEPVTAAQLKPGQVFRPFSGNEADISRDSAFTAAFQITNFDPYVSDTQGVYDAPVLKFNPEIPQNATIILLDRSNNSYWYYTAGSAVSSVNLTDFKKMGGSDTYSVPLPTVDNGYVDLIYQFIVDFSQSAGYTVGDLKMTLEASAKDSTSNAPPIKEEVTVTTKESSFKLEQGTADTGGLTNSFTCTYTEVATASKWEKRSSALILKPSAGTTLPPDARINAVVDGRTSYIYNCGNKFIVPMSLLKSGDSDQKVTLTLQSSLFPVESKSYEFGAEWLISRSKADKSPMNGDKAGTTVTVTFTSEAIAPPSLKPSSDSRVMTSSNRLELLVKWANMDNYLITATLQQKNDEGSFADFGWSSQQFNKGVTSHETTISVPLNSCSPGSYRVMLTVKSSDPNAVTIIMRVPYYFVVKE